MNFPSLSSFVAEDPSREPRRTTTSESTLALLCDTSVSLPDSCFRLLRGILKKKNEKLSLPVVLYLVYSKGI